MSVVAKMTASFASGGRSCDEVSPRENEGRTRLLQALHSKDPEAIKQARADAIKAGYSVAAVGAIGRTPSDVFLFSKLPEADQQAILRQANKAEFERYVGHAHQKLRRPMREERAGNQVEAPAPGASSASRPAVTSQSTPVPAPSRSAPPPPPRGRSGVDELLRTSPLSAM